MPGAQEADERAAELAWRLPPELAPLARIALDYRWSWDPDGAELFRALDPHAWELHARNPVRQLADLTPHAAEIAAVARPDPRADRPPAAGARGGPRAPGDADRRARRPGRLRLRGVRRPPVAADLLRRARRARRRHPQGSERPRAAGDRGRAALPQGVLPAARRPDGAAARVLDADHARAAPDGSGARRRRRPAHALVPLLRPRGRVPRLARRRSGACRSTSSTPSSRRTTRSTGGSQPGSTRGTRSRASASTGCSASGRCAPFGHSGSSPGCCTSTRATPPSPRSSSRPRRWRRAWRSTMRSQRRASAACSRPTPPSRPGTRPTRRRRSSRRSPTFRRAWASTRADSSTSAAPIREATSGRA